MSSKSYHSMARKSTKYIINEVVKNNSCETVVIEGYTKFDYYQHKLIKDVN